MGLQRGNKTNVKHLTWFYSLGRLAPYRILSQTNGEINGKWVFANANNTPRLARIDFKTFRTAEILELPNSAGNHSSPFQNRKLRIYRCRYTF